MTSTVVVTPLRYATFEVWPVSTCTRFPDGISCTGAREDTLENRLEAESQGYRGPLAVWRSLIEHELLHSVIAEVIFDRPSVVMRTEGGGERYPSWQRYEEEALCLALQTYFNVTSYVPREAMEFLDRYGCLPQLRVTWAKYSEHLRPLWESI